MVRRGRTGFRLRASLRETLPLLQLVLHQHLLHVVLHLVRVELRIVWHMRLPEQLRQLRMQRLHGRHDGFVLPTGNSPGSYRYADHGASRAANRGASPAAGSAANHGTNPAASRKIATASPP